MEDRFTPKFSLGVSQEQTTQKGVEEEEDEMHADIDHESVNQDPEAGKDNLIEEMDLKTSSENINLQRLTGRTKVASESLRSPYLVREVDITKSKTKEDDWKDEKAEKEEKNKGHEIIEYVLY
ncbi:hypothetical protein L1987_14520 [Smallanthus sonchifolius]|uniref:Uncharacterized protein n=1 Tax=Smallanthus sonchifolius TaxID=185202 RepID=A0ACB9J4L4_9ASTR|nr:hypothetical protein L1987_14520 [Smallanthus sonchifolius]